MSERGLAVPGDQGIWIQALSIPAPESIKAPSVVLEGYGGGQWRKSLVVSIDASLYPLCINPCVRMKKYRNSPLLKTIYETKLLIVKIPQGFLNMVLSLGLSAMVYSFSL